MTSETATGWGEAEGLEVSVCETTDGELTCGIIAGEGTVVCEDENSQLRRIDWRGSAEVTHTDFLGRGLASLG